MTTTTRKRGGLGGGGKRGGGGGGGGESRKTPTKTRKTTTTRATTTTTTKDAEKKNACVDFLSFFFLSFSEGAVKNKRNFLRERARARGGSERCYSGLQEQRGRDKKKTVRLSRRRSRVVLFLRAPARSDSFCRSLSLSFSLTHTTFQLSLSLSLSLSEIKTRIPVYFRPRLSDGFDEKDDGRKEAAEDDEDEENRPKGRRRMDQAIVSYPLRPPNRPYETKRCKSVLHKAIAGWMEMKVPTKEAGEGIEDDKETVVLRSDQRSSWEKHENQRSMLVARMNEEGELFLTPANVSHQMRPSLTHIVENGGRSAFKKRHAGNVQQEKENHEEATETLQEEERRIAREEQEALKKEKRRTMGQAGCGTTSLAAKIVPVSVSIKANETERQQERRKNSYHFRNSEREKETWSELEPTFASSDYANEVVKNCFSKKSKVWCGDRMVGAGEYLDAMCPLRGNSSRDLPDSENDENHDDDDDFRSNNISRQDPSHIYDSDEDDKNDTEDRMNIDDEDNNNENEEIRLNNDKSGDFDDVFVNGFQIRDVLKKKTIDERLDELFTRSGNSFMKFSGIKKLVPRNTKQKELLSAVAAKASLVNGVWVFNSALRSEGDRNYERARDSVLCSFSRGKKIPVNDGHNATKEEERLRQKALNELGAAARGPANQGPLFEFYPSRDDIFSRKYDSVVTQQKNRWEQILGFFERGKDFSPFEYLSKGPEVPGVDEHARKIVRRACETVLKPCFGTTAASSKKLESLPTVSDIRDVLKRSKSRYHALREPELLRLISSEPLIVIGGRIIGFHRVMNINDTTTNEEKRTKRAIVRELMLSTSGNIKKESVLKACEKIVGINPAKILQEMCTSSGGVWSIDLTK